MLMIIYFLFFNLGFAEPSSTQNIKNPEILLNRGMWVLNGWAIINMTTGIPTVVASRDPQKIAFYQMNTGWNVVNAGLATTSLVRKKTVDPQKITRIFFVNAGLDVGYIIAGVILAENGNSSNDPQMVGFGNSVILQGVFLFGFDVLMGWKMQKYRQ